MKGIHVSGRGGGDETSDNSPTHRGTEREAGQRAHTHCCPLLHVEVAEQLDEPNKAQERGKHSACRTGKESLEGLYCKWEIFFLLASRFTVHLHLSDRLRSPTCCPPCCS